MKRIPTLFLFLLFLCAACNDANKEPGKSENNLDAARNFLNAALDGDFKLAKKYMLPDSVNMQYLDVAERSYRNQPTDTINAYRGASIRFYPPYVQVNDSTSIIIFANSFKNNMDTLRVIRVNGDWLVDLKYLYQRDMDTAFQRAITMDSLPR